MLRLAQNKRVNISADIELVDKTFPNPFKVKLKLAISTSLSMLIYTSTLSEE